MDACTHVFFFTALPISRLQGQHGHCMKASTDNKSILIYVNKSLEKM